MNNHACLLCLTLLCLSACGRAGNPPAPSSPPPAEASFTSTLPASPPATSPTPVPPSPLPTAVPTDGAGADWQRYRHEAAGFTLAYPPDWLLTEEGPDALTLLPAAEQGWEAATPADLARDPTVHLLVGSLIRERIGPAFFPDTLTPDALRTWLEAKVAAGEGIDLQETIVGGHALFTLTELSESGCEQVAYWRPTDLSSLLRLATGCQSAYGETFHQMVASLAEVE